MFMMVLDPLKTHENHTTKCPMRLAQNPDQTWDCADCGARILWARVKVNEVKNEENAPMSTTGLQDLLGMVSAAVAAEDIQRWTTKQRNEAEEWAALEHLYASDNPVKRKPMPKFLKDVAKPVEMEEGSIWPKVSK